MTFDAAAAEAAAAASGSSSTIVRRKSVFKKVAAGLSVWLVLELFFQDSALKNLLLDKLLV